MPRFILSLQSEADSQTFLKLLINRSQFVFGWGRKAFSDRWWQKEEEETEPQGHPGNTTITFLIQGMAKLKINK